jgi:hypothetical protein
LRRTRALERLARWPEARAAADAALGMARAGNNAAGIFVSGIDRIRVGRLAGSSDDPEIAALRTEVSALAADPAVQRYLLDSPALLREAAAELGTEAPLLIAEALERLGLDAKQRAELVVRLEGSLSLKVGDNVITGKGLGSSIAKRIRDGLTDPTVLATIADVYSQYSQKLGNQVLKKKRQK